jgi:hypothetical protein
MNVAGGIPARYNADSGFLRGSTMNTVRRAFVATTAALVMAASFPLVAAQKGDKSKDKEQDSARPRITLRAQPVIAVAPARVVLTAELVGGADDFQEFYCPTVEWAWGDDTVSESTVDCDPYEAGKSQIKRRFTVEHTFRRAGAYKIYFHLKRKDKMLGSASITVQVQPGGFSQ